MKDTKHTADNMVACLSSWGGFQHAVYWFIMHHGHRAPCATARSLSYLDSSVLHNAGDKLIGRVGKKILTSGP